MTTASGISVIICTWNRSAILKQTLDSLALHQGCQALDIDVVVVDNNSSDDTRELVESYIANWPLGTLRYAFEPRQGKQFALNLGIQVTRNPLLAFTDDDILFPVDWLAKVHQVFKDESVDLAGGKTELIWPDSGKPRWYHPTMLAILAGVDLGDEKMPAPADYAPAGSNLIARRSLFERIGGYSEQHFRHMDYEFGMRSLREGAQVLYDPALVVFAPVDASCLTPRYFRRWSFKAGIATEISATDKALLLVPRCMYRQLLEDALFLVLRIFRYPDADLFNRELRIWRVLGLISSRWYIKYRPGQYLKWRENVSQKKKNLY